MKKTVKRELERYHNEKELFANNKEAIEQLNYQFLKYLLCGSIIMCAISSIVFVFAGEYKDMIFSYGLTTLIFIGIYLVYKLIPKSAVLPCFYMFFIALLVYSAYSAAIIYPNYTGVISLGVFVLMPIIILDRRMRTILIEIILLVVYLTFVIPRKEWVIHQDEIIYNISFAIIGIILGFYLAGVRVENLELLRLGILRETTDVLTGLYNRRKLFNYFGDFESGKIEENISGISILDIDLFKNYNDTYGHLAGDKCLKAVGDCMKAYGKQHNMEFYRYGGEEFVAIAHDHDREQLVKAFENINMAIENLQITRENGYVTISQGVFFTEKSIQKAQQNLSVEYDETIEGNHLKGVRFQQFLSQADNALYTAKENGRNRTVFAEEIINEDSGNK